MRPSTSGSAPSLTTLPLCQGDLIELERQIARVEDELELELSLDLARLRIARCGCAREHEGEAGREGGPMHRAILAGYWAERVVTGARESC